MNRRKTKTQTHWDKVVVHFVVDNDVDPIVRLHFERAVEQFPYQQAVGQVFVDFPIAVADIDDCNAQDRHQV